MLNHNPNPAVQALFRLPFTLPFLPTPTIVQTEIRSTINVSAVENI
jgi:hypothetical protein